MNEYQDELNEAGLRFAVEDEPGWYYRLENGDKVWATDLPLSDREADDLQDKRTKQTLAAKFKSDDRRDDSYNIVKALAKRHGVPLPNARNQGAEFDNFIDAIKTGRLVLVVEVG